MRNTIVSGAVAAMLAMPAMAAPSQEEMWKIIQQQQQQIEALQKQLLQQQTQLRETEVKVEATATAVETNAAAPATASWAANTTIGGYAEMHYNNWENQNNAPGAEDRNEVDFHRFVVFLGHQFNDRLRFFSEIELEHSIAGDDQNGEVELEQAYIEYDLNSAHRAKAGLFLMPVGILNETHEPDTFYGVERNSVENKIIPTTWWEGGVALGGEILPGFGYDVAVTGGLGLDLGKYKIRDGRQKVSEADADALAYTGRLKYTGIAGLELAASVQYQEDLYQENFIDLSGANKAVDAMLYEAHVVYQAGPFGLKALAARWDIDDRIEQVALGASVQEGWYVEPSWRFSEKLGVFTRYGEWDNEAGAGGNDTRYEQWDVGVNYWLHENVVLKADYQFQDAPRGKDEFNGFNLGVGVSF
ncbi:MAG: porin [Gammaproteobacteria bacterium]|nr:MAG: porin [Gammaproteobacteria bacterium]